MASRIVQIGRSQGSNAQSVCQIDTPTATQTGSQIGGHAVSRVTGQMDDGIDSTSSGSVLGKRKGDGTMMISSSSSSSSSSNSHTTCIRADVVARNEAWSWFAHDTSMTRRLDKDDKDEKYKPILSKSSSQLVLAEVPTTTRKQKQLLRSKWRHAMKRFGDTSTLTHVFSSRFV